MGLSPDHNPVVRTAIHDWRTRNIDRDQIACAKPKVPGNQPKIAQDQCSHLQHDRSLPATSQSPWPHGAAAATPDEGT
jgi:hypothetical protein